MFIDFKKAFDSIEHRTNMVVIEKVMRVLEKVYSDSKAYIRIEGKGQVFDIERGVKQRDPFSANLFTCTLEGVFKKLDWDGYGISIEGKKLNNLKFADDVVLMHENIEGQGRMAEELFLECRKYQ